MAGERVLVVDDNAINLKLVQVVLRAAGYEVATADDAEQARAEIGRAVPSLVLMDVQLPGTDGLKLTRELRADPVTAHVPVVAVTSYAMCGDEAKALEAGCVAYVTKPIDIHTLPDLVATHVALRVR